MLCLVCGAPEAEPHFGGLSCRACAAFFRRYFHSKKTKGICTCIVRYKNSHPCRECRIQKCLSIGMDCNKVQEKREKHARKQNLNRIATESPPSLQMSPLPLQIVSRDSPNISNIVLKWMTIQPKRREFYTKTIDHVTYYQTCSASKNDIWLVWMMVKTVFPQLESLSEWETSSLLRNFLPKWSLLVASIDFMKNLELYRHIVTVEDYNRMIAKFYRNSLPPDSMISDEEIVRVFEPFLRFYGLSLALPICAKKFDEAEYMALTLILLFDGAHTNISNECSALCHQIRKVVLRELKAYNEEKTANDMRFIETIDTVSLLEKGEAKFQEELLVCEMYNVHIHEDFQLLMKEHNY